MNKLNTEKSKEYYEELSKYLVDGVASSFHKAADESYPIVFTGGDGPYMFDVDGNRYIDYVGGLGPVILGYGSKIIADSISQQASKGTHLAAPGDKLLQLAKLATEIIPCAEKVSFQNSGTEANLFAFRVARAYTGKNVIIKFEGQYHGWADEEKITIDAENISQLGDYQAPNKIIHNPGQPETSLENVMVLPWNDLDIIEKTLNERDDVAAIIMEPFMCDSGPVPPAKGYLEGVRKITQEKGVVLIFDEVITGFRMALGGAQQYYNVTPDMATFAKALTGGLPMAMIAGRKEIMECGVHPSGTFNGNALSTAAAIVTLTELSKPGIYEKFEELGERFCKGVYRLGDKYGVSLHAEHAGAIITFLPGPDRPMHDFRDCLENLDYELYGKIVSLSKSYGLRFTPKRGRVYLSTAFTEEVVDESLDILEEVFKAL